MGRVLALIFVMAAAGCTTPIDPSAAPVVDSVPGNGPAQITVTRDSGVFGSACSFHIAVDGAEVGILDPGRKLVYRTSAGSHEIRASVSQFCGGAIQYYSATAAAQTNIAISVGSSSNQAIVIRHDQDSAIR
jgi:hypothetical protein